jgi:hypothetical protein
MPDVANRHDPDAAELQQSMNPALVLAALDEHGSPDERSRFPGKGKEGPGGAE